MRSGAADKDLQLGQAGPVLIRDTLWMTHVPGYPGSRNAHRTGSSSERPTSVLTVGIHLQKRWSAQRWAAPYSHGGVLVGSLTIG